MKLTKNTLSRAISSLFATAILSGCVDEIVYLDQNWNEDNKLRELSYNTSQGSQLIPYDWFLHLQDPKTGLPLRSDLVIAMLGYLPTLEGPTDTNPDELPIGFVKDSDPETGDWIGINCAACHTKQIIFNNTAIRIDGAPGMGDWIGLLTAVKNSLEFTLANKREFKRFSRYLDGVESQSERDQLKMAMLASIEEIDGIIFRNQSPDHTPGFGRIDAFTSIRNEVLEHDLGVPENHRAPSAPVSYPFLWNTADLEKVQWAGNVENPYARNTGQVLGVLGRLELQDPSNLFSNSVRRENLYELEEAIRELKAPQWPENILGTFDQESASRGYDAYTTVDSSGYSCASCHALPNEAGLYPLTPAADNLFGQQFIKTMNIPLADIGTDPNTLQNIYDPTPLSTGSLAPLIGGTTELPGAFLLSFITQSTVVSLFSQEPPLDELSQAAYSGLRVGESTDHPIGYKARPLNGIWATAPFLHNGSVPTLYDLLLPQAQRPATFWMGAQTFDNEKVGVSSFYLPGLFNYDTNLSGNKNTGHLYGTELNHQEKMDLVEFMKTL